MEWPFYKDKIIRKWSNISMKWEILIFALSSAGNNIVVWTCMWGLAQLNMPQFMKDLVKVNPEVVRHKSGVREVNIKQFAFQLEHIYYLYGTKHLQEHVETVLLSVTYLKSISQYNLIHDFCSLIVFLNQKTMCLFRWWERWCFLW